MSDELQDEVEAINSIYGDGSLTPADSDTTDSVSTYILKLPHEASSLRIQFPVGYPAEPPSVLGTQHSSGGVKGAGARDFALFTESLGLVFTPGVVCLFDAVEEFSRRHEEEVDTEDASTSAQEQQDTREEEEQYHIEDDLSSMPPPPWVISDPIVENRSTFIARVAPVTSTSQAESYVHHLLASDKRIRSATHNMTAWRIRGENGTSYQDCDDDGETAAGSRLLHLMQLMELWDAMVVVTRWYGGVKLGPRRFAVINAAARDGFVKAGMVGDKEKDKKKR